MKVSVLLPTYNRADLVERAIKSFIEQDYKDSELLILNDNSTDNTRQVLSFYNNNERIKIFNVDINFGPPKNQNFLWEQASGDLVCQLHDDDQLTTDSLSKRVELFKKDPNLQMVYGGAILQNINGDQIGTLLGYDPDKNRIMKHEYINFVTMMYRRDIPFKFEPGLRFYFDWLFKIRCLNELKCGYTPESVVKHTMHPGQETELCKREGLSKDQEQQMWTKLKEYGYNR